LELLRKQLRKTNEIYTKKRKKKRIVPRSLIHALLLCPPAPFDNGKYYWGADNFPTHPMSFVSCQYLMSGFLFASLFFCGMLSVS
jgi:hypothetical protein